MDHIVYVDAKSQEMEKILTGEKTMIVRSAMGRKMPYGRVERGDCFCWILSNSTALVSTTWMTGCRLESLK
jgi:hypothetical protein